MDYEVKIKTTAEGQGAAQTAEGLKKVGDASEQAGKKAETQKTHVQGLHKVIQALNESLPGLGTLLQAAFSPVGAAITVAVMALRAFREHIAAVNEELDKMAEQNAKPLTNRVEAMRQATVNAGLAMADLDARLKDAARSEQGFKEQIEAAVAAQKAQVAAEAPLAEALEKAELARIERLHAEGLMSEQQYNQRRMELELQFAAWKRKQAEDEELAEIKIRERGLAAAKKALPGAKEKAAFAGLKSVEAGENLAAMPSEQRVQEQLKFAQDALERFRKEHPYLAQIFGQHDINEPAGAFRPSGLGRLAFRWGGGTQAELENFDELWREWTGLRGGHIAALKAYARRPTEARDRAIAAADAKREADDAARQAEAIQRSITEGDRDLLLRRGMYQERVKINQGLGGFDKMASPAGGAVQTGIDIAQAMAQGLPVTNEAKTQLIQIASAIAGKTLDLRGAVTQMALANRDMASLTHSIDRLVGSMENLGPWAGQLTRRVTILEQQFRNNRNVR